MSTNVNTITSSIGDAVDNAASTITDQKTWGRVKTAAVGFVKESWVVMLIIVVMILLVVIVVYIFYMIKRNSLQKLILHTDIINLGNRSIVPRVINNADATLSTVNGQEFSYSFWLFLSDTYDATVNHKMLLVRGTADNGSISNLASPVVAMGATSNNMYIGVSTTKAVTSNSISSIFAQEQTGVYSSGYLVVNIPYIPLQRWVNVILVVKDTSMYTYVDGDIMSIVSVEGISTPNLRYSIRGTTGDISIGDSTNPTQGYMSLTQFFNFALTQNDVTAIYKNGPSKKSWLAFLGLGNYGVRSPVYRMN